MSKIPILLILVTFCSKINHLLAFTTCSFAPKPHFLTKTFMLEDLTSTSLGFLSTTTPEFVPFSSSNILAFADQGQNLAGIFFQASLLPYLLFLYFLNYNREVPKLGQFAFQFLLIFVFATIPSGIISKTIYDSKLADVDWLHGGAETLLTITSLLVVFSFRGASTGKAPSIDIPRALGLGSAGLFALACGLGPTVGQFQAHSPFLLGLGNLANSGATLPWVTHVEPMNALSIPTWAIHFSSVFEWIFAMNILWNFSFVTNNPKWKGMAWGMLPLHASGLAACTYHFFYNNPNLQFLVDLQAGLTCLGNITLAIAAYRIAVSNGWKFDDLIPFSNSQNSETKTSIKESEVIPLRTDTLVYQNAESELSLLLKLTFLTISTAYVVKYGELALDLPFSTTPNPLIPLALVFAPAILTAKFFADRSSIEDDNDMFSFLPKQNNLSMEDVKKYGVAGTVAYILTEVAFWAVAFPVASAALYQTTGHWPDFINSTADRATVLGFVFAGANIARLAVPLRFGTALALAPWVDENIINRQPK